MQNRASYIDNEGETGGYDWQIRRLRLRFDGFVGNPKFLYAIQLSFAPGDTGPLVEGDNYNIIRDAVIMYRPNTHWNFSFGQTKLPGNRQRVNSSGALQLTDRSINNARFNIDRDFGFQIHNLNESLIILITLILLYASGESSHATLILSVKPLCVNVVGQTINQSVFTNRCLSTWLPTKPLAPVKRTLLLIIFHFY